MRVVYNPSKVVKSTKHVSEWFIILLVVATTAAVPSAVVSAVAAAAADQRRFQDSSGIRCLICLLYYLTLFVAVWPFPSKKQDLAS
jgi:hypothetical protein